MAPVPGSSFPTLRYRVEASISLVDVSFSMGDLFSTFAELENRLKAYAREKNVDPCYLETKKYSLQLLGTRKKTSVILYLAR